MEHSNGQNVQLSSCLTLWTVKWLKSKARKILSWSIKDGHIRYMIHHFVISLGSMGLKIAEPLSSLLHVIQCRSRATLFNFIHFYSAHFDVHGKVNTNGYCPEKHMKHIWTNPKTHQTFIIDEPCHRDFRVSSH